MEISIQINSVSNIQSDALIMPISSDGGIIGDRTNSNGLNTYWTKNCYPLLRHIEITGSLAFFVHPLYDVPSFNRFIVSSSIDKPNIDFLRQHLLSCLNFANRFNLKKVAVLCYFSSLRQQPSIDSYLKAIQQFKDNTDNIYIEELCFNVESAKSQGFFDLFKKSISQSTLGSKSFKQDGKRKLSLE